MRREQFEPPHQHVEQPFARRFLRHVGIDAGEHRAVGLLDVGGKDRQRGVELVAQIGERHVRALGDCGEADLLERLISASNAMKVSMMRSRGGLPDDARGDAVLRDLERAALRAMIRLLGEPLD